MFNISQLGYRPAGVEEVNFSVFVQGSILTINGEEFDFSFMEKESTLPREAIGSEHFCSDVICDSQGVINLTIRVPYRADASHEEIYPAELLNKKYGKVIDINIPAFTTENFEVQDVDRPQ